MPLFNRTILTLLLYLVLQPSGFAAQTNLQTEDSTMVSVLGEGYQTVIYKGSMDVFGNHFSGLFFFKRMDAGTKRMVLLSEFGLNLLDFQFSNDSARLMNGQEFLNRPGLIELMKGDFGFLLNGIKVNDVVKTRCLSEKGGMKPVKVKTKEGRFTLYYSVTDDQLMNVKQKKGWFSSVKYRFSYKEESLPEEILIRHTGIPFKMKLKKIKSE